MEAPIKQILFALNERHADKENDSKGGPTD
jgi:hypothetical protein